MFTYNMVMMKKLQFFIHFLMILLISDKFLAVRSNESSDYQWIAVVQTVDSHYLCNGLLIDSETLLTASECLYDQHTVTKYRSADSVKVLIQNSHIETNYQVKSYKISDSEHDGQNQVALLKISKEHEDTETYEETRKSLPCLSSKKEIPATLRYVHVSKNSSVHNIQTSTGLSCDGHSSDHSHLQQQVEVYHSHTVSKHVMIRRCEHDNHQSNVCKVKTGSPLFVKNQEQTAVYGIATKTWFACDNNKVLRLFVATATHRAFIEKHSRAIYCNNEK